MDLSIKIFSQEHIARAKRYIGRYYREKEDYGSAVNYYLDALRIEEKRKDKRRMAILYGDLGYIYQLLENFNKAFKYYSDELSLSIGFKDTLYIAKALSHLGSLYTSRKFCEKRTEAQTKNDCNIALDYFKRSLLLNEKIRSEISIANGNLNIANILNITQKSEEAYKHVLIALTYFKKTEDLEGIGASMFHLGKTYRGLRQYNKAIQCFKEALELSVKIRAGGILYIYEELSQTYDEAGDYKNARDYFIKYMILRDSIYAAEKSSQVFELETKYQTEKKAKEVLNLELKEKQKKLFIYILTSIILILCFSGLYIIYIIRRKKILAEQANKIKDQTIIQLEKDRQIVAAHAVLEGEEKERSRLSRDLHDGLGGMLSVVKSKLTGMKGNYILNEENVSHFDHAINLLDDSIKELRRVSQNMMPETLVKFGIKDALQDFCYQLSADNRLTLTFKFFGDNKRFESSLEITLYRIAQELVNNALKHSQAKEIFVQIVQENRRIHLTVIDDGQGFDPSKVDTTKSNGLKNIRARVESFKGHLDIDSKPGKGTEIGVEFEIK